MSDLLSRDNGKNRSFLKILTLFILEIGAAFLTGFYLRQFLLDFNPQKLIWCLLGLSCFLIFSFLAALFDGGFLRPSAAMGISTIVSLAALYDHFSSLLVFSGLAVFLAFIWAIFSFQKEAESSLEIKFFRLAKIYLGKATLGLALLFVLFFYFLSPAPDGFPISFENFQILLQPSEKIISVFLPEFNFQKSLESVLFEMAEKQLAAAMPSVGGLPAASKKALIEESIRQGGILETLEGLVGGKISLKDSADKTIFQALRNRFGQLNEITQQLILLIVFAALFLTVKICFVPIKWLVALFAFLLYLLLLAFNFVIIQTEPRSKEVIQI